MVFRLESTLVSREYQTRKKYYCGWGSDEIDQSGSYSLLHRKAVRTTFRTGQTFRRRSVSSLENRDRSVAVAAVQSPCFSTCDTYCCWPYIHESTRLACPWMHSSIWKDSVEKSGTQLFQLSIRRMWNLNGATPCF